jgi:ribosomal protein S18 acetylase RimI-like enzyme
MELSIRKAELPDAEIVAEYNRLLAWESEQIQLENPVVLAGVRACLSDPNKGFYTLATIQGEVVGQTLVTFEWSDWRNGWFWWIQSVYVREDYRRAGVFRQLYQHIQNSAIDDPLVIGLRLYVESHNERAKKTYRSLGMSDTPYGMLEIYPLPGRESLIVTAELPR